MDADPLFFVENVFFKPAATVQPLTEWTWREAEGNARIPGSPRDVVNFSSMCGQVSGKDKQINKDIYCA